MVTSKAATVAAFLKALPADRRAALSKVRRVIKKHLPRGYRELMNWGMISYEVPLDRYTYNGRPLMYVGLAAQKNYASLHLVAAYGNPVLGARLKAGFKAAGKRLNMGKACIRFREAEDLELEVIGEIIASVPMERYIAYTQAAQARRRE